MEDKNKPKLTLQNIDFAQIELRILAHMEKTRHQPGKPALNKNGTPTGRFRPKSALPPMHHINSAVSLQEQAEALFKKDK